MRKSNLFAVVFLSANSAFAQCPSNLSHLDSRLPKYNHPSLQQARAAILSEDLNAAYQKMQGAGLSPAQAASNSLKSAEAAEGQREVAKQCIRQVSSAPDNVITSLENGTYNFSSGSIVESCAAGYVLMYYTAVAMKEVALGVACRARN